MCPCVACVRHLNMSIERLAWTAVIAVFLITAALFVHNAFHGYGLLSALLALAASVNVWASPAAERDPQ
jgi:hypothetical protein